jgi:hypothetical protein
MWVDSCIDAVDPVEEAVRSRSQSSNSIFCIFCRCGFYVLIRVSVDETEVDPVWLVQQLMILFLEPLMKKQFILSMKQMKHKLIQSKKQE